jgi:hypothetical protein
MCLTMHRNHPQRTPPGNHTNDPGNTCVFRTQQDFLEPALPRSLAPSRISRSDKIVHNASEPSPSDRRGLASLRRRLPGQTYDRTTGPCLRSKDRMRVTRAQRRTRT